MLRINEKGDLVLTKHGRVLATLFRPMVDDITIEQLVHWENTARMHDFETSDEVYTKEKTDEFIRSEKRHAIIYPEYSPDEAI